MQNKFCPKCGKKTNDLVKNLCFRCFSRGLNLIRIPKRIEVKICEKCKSFLYKGKWVDYKDFDGVIEQTIYKNMKTAKGTFVKINYKKREIKGKTIIPLELKAELDVNGRRLTEKEKLELIFTQKICEKCSRIAGNYYEAIIQLRTTFNKKLKDFIKDRVSDNQKNFITRIDKSKVGIDIYLGLKNNSIKIANECKRIYTLKIKKSYKLYGEKKGKKLYRVTISLKE